MDLLWHLFVFLLFFALALGFYGSYHVLRILIQHIKKYKNDWGKYYYYAHIKIQKYNWLIIIAIIILLVVSYADLII